VTTEEVQDESKPDNPSSKSNLKKETNGETGTLPILRGTVGKVKKPSSPRKKTGM